MPSPVDPLQGWDAGIRRLLLFSMTPYVPRSEKRCLPPKMALIQIKLNEVSVANPCVFQLLKHPLPYQWVGQARCIWRPLHWPCSQAARFPVPDRGDSRPPLRLSAPLQLHVRVFLYEHVCFTVNMCCVIPFLTHMVLIPFCLFCLCAFVYACVHSWRKIYFCLWLAHTFQAYICFLLRSTFF